MKRMNIGQGFGIKNNNETYEIYITDLQENEFTMRVKTEHQEKIYELFGFLSFSREDGVLKIKGRNGSCFYIETEENRKKLRVGDYISEPNIEDKYSDGDYVLSQIIRNGSKYTRLFIDKLITEDKLYDTIDELKENLHEDAYFYYVDDDFKFTEGRYLVYSQESGCDYEINVAFEEKNDGYTVLIGGANDYFGEECEKGFYELKDVEDYLREDFNLIKKLRYSIHE